MTFLKTELMDRLMRNGVTQACGKPLQDATYAELQDEWGRFMLQHKTSVKHRGHGGNRDE
jgi:hypothetical protein